MAHKLAVYTDFFHRAILIDFKRLTLIAYMRGEGHFTIGSYGGVHSKNLCYDPIPKLWPDFEAQSQKLDVVSDQCLH